MGGVNIPLEANNLQPTAPIDPLQEFARASALKTAAGEQAIQQQQVQGMTIANQQAAQAQKDQQAATAAMHDPDFKDFDSLPALISKHGGSANAVLNAQQQIYARLTQKAALTKDQLSIDATHNDAQLGALKSMDTVPDAELPGHLLATAQDLMAKGHLDQQHFPAIQQIAQLAATDPVKARQSLSVLENGLIGDKAQNEQAHTIAETHASQAKADLDNADAGLKQLNLKLMQGSKPGMFDSDVDNIFPPSDAKNQAANAMLKAQINNALSRPGGYEDAKKFVSSAMESVQSTRAAIQKETDPAVQAAKLHLAVAEKSAEQAIADGDPKAAAKLLVDETVAPSQLISSRKPAFAQQAFTEAEKMQPGWSATKADADYKVASSPQQVAFFGSAKSLTDKGGTLDQLKDAGKDIPQNDIPVFNTVADAIKASTGSGPIAKYAAIALGVADDYAKVMGGGQGSDTSRTQALNIISAKQSPEQRESSLEGIREAVGSQTNSRIGNNDVLRKMYGGSVPEAKTAAGPPAGATHTAKGSDGKMHYTNAQGQDLGVVPK